MLGLLLAALSLEPPLPGVRINKALRAAHSRRETDRLVAEGRVLVNGERAVAGVRLARGDTVQLDGVVFDWERLNPDEGERAAFVYVKYNKPKGVTCTTDLRVRRNIISSLGALPGVRDRIFPVGRLDKDSTGLILLTSDGGIVNRLLRRSEQKAKRYVVDVASAPSAAQLRRLREGVVITTVAQRDGVSKPLTAPTAPCTVDDLGGGRLRFEISEGRNRQIRRMVEAVGLGEVRRLHRVAFAGVGLEGCEKPGAYAFLSEGERSALGLEPDG